MSEPSGLAAGADPAPRGLLGRLDATGVPTLLSRVLVGGVFIHHGLVKVAEPVVFLKSIKNYDILPLEPPFILNGIAIGLPWIEVVIGFLLVLGLARRGAAVITFGMLCVFTVAVTMLALDYQAQNPDIAFTAIKLDCGCGGGPINVAFKLAENVGLILLSFWLMVSKSHRFAIRPFG